MKPVDPLHTRQAHKGNRVIIILVSALVLALIVFAGLGIYGWVLPEETLPQAGVESDVTTAPIEGAGEDAGTVVTPQESQPVGEAPGREN